MPSDWGTFANMWRWFQSLTMKAGWRHVPDDLNPTNLPSCGCSGKALLSSSWWEQPSWLERTEEGLPNTEVQFNEVEITREKRKGVIPYFLSTTMVTTAFFPYCQILRITGWLLWFIRNYQKKNDKLEGELLVAELEGDERKLLNVVQYEILKEDGDFKLKLKSHC